MKLNSILTMGVLAMTLAAPAAHAQTKKELVQKLIQLQQPGIESVARTLAEQPVGQMLQAAGMVLQSRVPAEKREGVAQGIEGDVKKYADEAVPLLRDRAMALAPSTMGVELEKFSEAELKQLITYLESPTTKKFLAALPQMQNALAQKLVEDSRGTIEPKLKTLEGQISQRLTAAAGAPPSGGGLGSGLGGGTGGGLGGGLPAGGTSSGGAPRK